MLEKMCKNVSHINFLVLLSCLSWVCGLVLANITTTQFLRDSEELVSRNSMFKFGFFSPGNSTYRYAGIWYNNKNDSGNLEVTWIANRDNPLANSTGWLRVSADGDLQLLNGQNNTVWSSNVSVNHEVNDSIAQLLDTGNLVLLSNSSGNVIWQSFDHLTDAWLPLMNLSVNFNTNTKKQLVSWKSASDPSRGNFTAGINARRLSEGVIWDGDRPYWRSGPWNGQAFLGITRMYYELVQMGGFRLEIDHGSLDLTFSVGNESLAQHFVLTFDGNMVQKIWDENSREWVVVWQSRESECDIYGKCGNFGGCNSYNSQICSCLSGFEPVNSQEWRQGNWTSGCFRRTPLQCGIAGGKEDGFFRLSNVKVPDNSGWLFASDEDNCKQQCLGNCSCLAYAYYVGIGCMVWSERLIDVQIFHSVGVDLFIRLADSDPALDGSRSRSRWTIVLAIPLSLGLLIFAIAMFCLWRLKRHRSGDVERSKFTSKNRHKMVSISNAKLQDLPLLKFEELASATNDFDSNNKLGQGGFGPVFKGILNGQEIAVKRLSRASGQGLQEFMNEVDVISKLQHRNLVRLLGCCAEGEEKMLVYEYMPNKSLDVFLFDPLYHKLLDWKTRLNIIEGICRGLLYLHRDSRLRIIHRDLKASNILLDENLKAKISDFGMARIFGGNEDQGNTKRVVGTYGYMSPEYAMEGRFSEKSDVYSFGVLLLEVVSGRKNTSFNGEESLSLIKYAWKLRNEGDLVSLIDATINDPNFGEEILRCIELGLLCVQESPEERPSISTIISMLDFEIIDLPQPIEPVSTHSDQYYTKVANKRSPQNYDKEDWSVNNVSLTSLIFSGR